MKKADLVVTRHPALVALLKELNLVDSDVEVISHVADPDVLDDRVVAGVLPLSLASQAKEVWDVRLHLTPELRGKELDLETLKSIFGGVFRYNVENLGQIK